MTQESLRHDRLLRKLIDELPSSGRVDGAWLASHRGDIQELAQGEKSDTIAEFLGVQPAFLSRWLKREIEEESQLKEKVFSIVYRYRVEVRGEARVRARNQREAYRAFREPGGRMSDRDLDLTRVTRETIESVSKAEER